MKTASRLGALLFLTGSLLTGCPRTIPCPDGTIADEMNGCIPYDAAPLPDGGEGDAGDAMILLPDGGLPMVDGGGVMMPDAPIDTCPTRAFFADVDGDGFGDPDTMMVACTAPAGFIEDDTDCDDGAELINPMATERCDMARLDENCDGTANEGCECYVGETRTCPGESEVGECVAGTQSCDAMGRWMAACMGTIRPITEACDNRDNDCDSMVDDGPEADADCGAVANGRPDCVAGACLNLCDSGFADCGSGSGCETMLGTPTHCTGCGVGCGWSCRTDATGCTDPTSLSMSPLGPQTTCAVRAGGSLACWGDNNSGEVGDGTTTDATRPRVITFPAAGTVVSAATGVSHSCAVLVTPPATSGNVYCWGDNRVGQLGTSGGVDSLTPVLVPALSNAVEVVAGNDFTCARTATGAVRCWGENGAHQLGQDSTTDSATPVTVTGLTSASRLDAATFNTCAVTSTGSVVCWGASFTGRETTTLPGGLRAVRVAVGGSHRCALSNAGSVFCWGSNASGQIGNGSTTDVSTPTQVGDFGTGFPAPTALDVAAGDSHTCVVTSAGRVSCWGRNTNGQLGDGTTANRTVPTFVPTLTGAFEVEAGNSSTCAFTRNPGDVTNAARTWCWGSNLGGELGDGSTTGRTSPVATLAPAPR